MTLHRRGVVQTLARRQGRKQAVPEVPPTAVVRIDAGDGGAGRAFSSFGGEAPLPRAVNGMNWIIAELGGETALGTVVDPGPLSCGGDGVGMYNNERGTWLRVKLVATRDLPEIKAERRSRLEVLLAAEKLQTAPDGVPKRAAGYVDLQERLGLVSSRAAVGVRG